MSETREGCVFFYSSENAVALPKQPEKVVRDGTARGTPDVAARCRDRRFGRSAGVLPASGVSTPRRMPQRCVSVFPTRTRDVPWSRRDVEGWIASFWAGRVVADPRARLRSPGCRRMTTGQPLREGIGGGPLTGVPSMREMLDMPFDAFADHARGAPPPGTPVPRPTRESASETRARRPFFARELSPPPFELGGPEDPSVSYDALVDLDRRAVPGRGLSPMEKARLRRVATARLLKDAVCPISRERFRPGESAVRLPCACSRVVFQERAILRWLDEHRSCPVCRVEF